MTYTAMQYETCYECFVEKPIAHMMMFNLYDSPWDELPKEKWLCDTNYDDDYGSCADKLTDNSWSDFRYSECDICQRLVCNQSPKNGWHVQMMWYKDEYICLKCYEKEMFLYGIDEDTIDDRSLSGMFFNYDELEEQGFKRDSIHFAASTYDAIHINARMRELISEGNYVLLNYERMAIGGLEGDCSIWKRKNTPAAEIC